MNRTLTLFAMTCAVVLPTMADDPPAPNRDKPVNYVDWMESRFGKARGAKTAAAYAEAVRLFQNDEGVLAGPSLLATEWPDAHREAVRAWVDRNHEALEKLRKASRPRRCYFPMHTEAGSIVLATYRVSLSDLRSVAKACLYRAVLRIRAGDVADGLGDVATVLRVSRHFHAQQSISYLVGMALSKQAYQVVIALPILAPGEVDYDAARRLLRGADQPPHPFPVHYEMAITFEMLQRHARDTTGDGRLDQLDDQIGLSPAITFDQGVRQARKYYATYAQLLDADYPHVRQLRRKLERSGSLMKNMGLSPRMDTLIRLRDAYRSGARITVRLHAWRAAHGEWPTELAVFMKGESSWALKDPFSGEPFVYELRNGQPLCYSLGPDGDDDGGRAARGTRPDDDGDLLIWPTE